MKWTPYSRLVSVTVWIRYEQAEKSGEVCGGGRAGLLVKEMYLSLNARESYPIFWQLESVQSLFPASNQWILKRVTLKPTPDFL